MPRRSVGGSPDDPAMHALRPKMACLSFLPGPAVVRADDSPLKMQGGPPVGWEEERGMESERRVTWTYGKGGLRLPRRNSMGIWGSARKGDRRRELIDTISVGHSIRALVRSDGRGGRLMREAIW